MRQVSPLLKETGRQDIPPAKCIDAVSGTRAKSSTRQYDIAGNLTSLTDPDRNTTTWQYNADNQVTLQIDPTGAQTITTYNAAGLVATIKDANGRTKSFTYNADRHATQEVWTDSSNTVVDTRNFTYYANGSLHTASNNAGTYTYSYNAKGWVATTTDPNGITLTYGYDAAGNVTSVSDSRGGLVSSTYDNANLLLTRSQSGTGVTPLSVKYSYDSESAVSQVRRYNDATFSTLASKTDYTRDGVSNILTETHRDGSNNVLASYTNVYDNQNRITSETRNGVVTNDSYDAASQVTSSGGQSYSYTPNGNRNMAGYSVGLANQVTSDGTWNYSFDAVGNTVAMTKIADGSYWTFGYNFNNQVTSAGQYSSSGSLLQQVNYVYDVLGDMLSRTVTISGNSTTQKFAYDVSGATVGINANVNPMWAELDAAGNIVTRYLIDDNGGLLARSGSGTYGTAWLLTDRLGSVREILNSAGALLGSVSYNAFGNITSETDPAITGYLTYGGMRQDRATNFLMGNYRFLLPNGQWSGVDELGFAAGDVNTRRDVGNNGTNATDKSGLESDLYRKALIWLSQNHHPDLAVAQAVYTSLQDMLREDWKPSIARDSGAFGKEVHARAAKKLENIPGWVATDIYVDNSSKKIVAIGSPPSIVKGTTQIDMMYVKQGYENSIKVGEVLDSSKVLNVYDIKTSSYGKIDPEQAARIKAVLGAREESKIVRSVTTPVRYTEAKGWHDNAKYKTGLKLFGAVFSGLVLAPHAYAMVHSSEYDNEIEAIHETSQRIKGEQDEIVAKADTALLLKGQIKTYLEHFIPPRAALELSTQIAVTEVLKK